MSVGPSNDGRRRRPWNRGASSSPPFSSRPPSVRRSLPSPVPGAPGNGSDAIVNDAAAAGGIADAAHAGGEVGLTPEEKKGPAIRLTSSLLGSPEHQQRQPRVGAVSPTWNAKSGRLYGAVSSDNQKGGGEGGGGGRIGDDGQTDPSRPSAVSAAAKAAAKSAYTRGHEGATPASSPRPAAAPAPASASAAAPPCYEEALARSAASTRSVVPPATERADVPPAAVTAKREVQEERRSGRSDSEETATVGAGKGVKVARQMWERRASSVAAELQDDVAGSPRGNQASPRGGGGRRRKTMSAHERRPSAGVGMGAGSGVANMKVRFRWW